MLTKQSCNIIERETSQIRATDNGPKDNGPSAVSSATGGANVDTGLNTSVKDESAEESTIAQRRQSEKSAKRSNPHKYLLYRPTLSQLMVYLATAFKVTDLEAGLASVDLEQSFVLGTYLTISWAIIGSIQ